MSRPIRAAVALFAVFGIAASGCVIDRKAECIDAEACDRALEQPFGDFNADDATFGDLGTCWQTEDTAAPCVAACNTFRADQVELATEQNNLAVIEACGGSVE
jgi:hypothetical protein